MGGVGGRGPMGVEVAEGRVAADEEAEEKETEGVGEEGVESILLGPGSEIDEIGEIGEIEEGKGVLMGVRGGLSARF